MKSNLAYFTAHRGSVFIEAWGSLFWGAFAILAATIMTTRVSSAFGYSRGEIILISAFFTSFHGLFRGLFALSFQNLATYANNAKLDIFLTKPLDIQFLLTFRHITINRLARVFIGFLVFIPAVVLYFKISINLSFTMIIPLLLCAICYVSIGYSIYMFASSVIIKNPLLSNVYEFSNNLIGLSRFPSPLYEQFGFIIFYLVFPFISSSTLAANVLLGKNYGNELLILFFSTLLIFYISRSVFLSSLDKYTSAN